MEWRKPSQAVIDLFEAVAPQPPVAERRKMFGMPCSFINGQMFMGVFQESLILRLPEEKRAELLAVPGAVPFAPAPGRVMREYVVVPPTLQADHDALRGWVAQSLAYAQSLPPKKKKAAKAAAKSAKKKSDVGSRKPARRK